MLPTFEQGLGLAIAAIGLAVLLLLAGRGGWRHLSIFGLNFSRPRDKTDAEIEAERVERREARAVHREQLGIAFQRYSETAVAMVPMVEARGPADQSLGSWFDVAAAAIAASLALAAGDHYRVAIWADLGDPDSLLLLGSANHRKGDPTIKHLGKVGTIGGEAFKAKSGEYLCRDRRKDRRYKTKSKRTKPYLSIFAIRVGEPDRPWGVMTIDAPTVGDEAFRETDLVIVRRFAALIAAGAAIAIARYTPRTLAVAAAAAVAPPRIVEPKPSGDEPGEAA